ncbi:unnamed protein product [Closterium sp. NIES-64]|nr:unnamed protein product [Closterium sp. NIES-64]
MRTMRASPAGLLLLALALICAAHLMKAAYGDDTVTSITHRMTHRSMLKDLHASGQEKVPEGDSMGGSALNKVTARVLLDTPTSGTPVDRTGTPVDSFGTPDGTGGGNLADGGGSLFDSNPSPARSILNLGSELQFATTVAVGKARLSFGSQRCVSVPKKARGKGAQVWWNGRGGSGGAGSSSAAAGFACSQVKFFGKDGCQGAALDRMVNPGAAAAKFPSNKKNLRKWASVTSVLCIDAPCDVLGCEPGGKCVVDETGERYCQWGEFSGATKVASLASVLCVGAPCDALGCEPGGKCVVDETGERYCQWDSPCDATPLVPYSPLTTHPVAPAPLEPPARQYLQLITTHPVAPALLEPPARPCLQPTTVWVGLLSLPTRPLTLLSSPHSPYCSCPDGYGMTPTECVEVPLSPHSLIPLSPRSLTPLSPRSLLSPTRPTVCFTILALLSQPATVTAYSATFIVNRNADDNSSRPYTFRLNLNGCTQYPDAVAGRFTAAYIVDNIDDAPRCPSFNLYSTDNCEDDRDYQDKSESSDPFAAGYALIDPL